MSPESAGKHRLPISVIDRLLGRRLPESAHVLSEASLALPRLLRLGAGDVLPSRLPHPRAIEADLAVFDQVPRFAQAEAEEAKSFTTHGLRLAVEVLSKRTWRSDLGAGKGDAVDRWRSYLLSGVPELWIVNTGVEGKCPLLPMSGLFLRNTGDAWAPLDVEAPVHAPGEVHGLRPVAAGVVRSALGFGLDVGTLFESFAKVIAEASRVDDAPSA